MRLWRGLVVALLVALPAIRAAHAVTTPKSNTVLILGSSVTGGIASNEAARATELGFAVEIVDDTAWAAKTTADFASYRAIIIGDPTCVYDTSPFAAAAANTGVWGPAVTGNVLILGTDATFHEAQGGALLTMDGIAFATGDAGNTGAYVTLGCSYRGAPAGTPVPLLNAFATNGFTVDGTAGALCYNDAHLVATAPAFSTLVDADLANWSCSLHEAFDTWPGNFVVLAIARGLGTSFTASDGTSGTPYIVARGQITNLGLSLTPPSGTSPSGQPYSVTARYTPNGSLPTSGAHLVFSVTTGPNAGVSGTCNPADCLTDANGQVTWTYVGTGAAGTDVIRVFVDLNGGGVIGYGEPLATAQMQWTKQQQTSIEQYAIIGSPPASTTGSTSALVTLGIQSTTMGNVCVDSIVMLNGSQITGDAVAQTTTGSAVKFNVRTTVTGNVSTNPGGVITNRQDATVGGTVDTTGQSPAMTDCSDARTLVTSRRSDFLALAGTAKLDAVAVKRTKTTTITLSPGQNVIDVPSILVRHYGTLRLQGVAGTTQVIVRVSGNMKLGTASKVALQGMTPDQVLFLVEGNFTQRRASELNGTVFVAKTAYVGWGATVFGQFIGTGNIRVRRNATVEPNAFAGW